MTIGFNRIREGDLAKHNKLLVTHESLWSDSFYEDAASLVPLSRIDVTKRKTVTLA
jgi:hypothetical protein